jgi:hypothetical protein
MNEDIIRMAREAGGCEYGNANPDIESTFILKDDQIKAFDALVRADERKASFDKAELWLKRINAAVLAEREACATLCEEVLEQYRGTAMGKHAELVGDECAAVIRARGQG